MNKVEVLADIGTPASQIMVHPHCNHQEVLVRIQVHPGEGIEVGVTEYNVALRSSQPVIETVIRRDFC
jgi:hypothetical protein